ncbi:MAG: phosphoribosylaminoimidazolesuccinocarboxamide synthase [Patescibacteria group bacterium]|jgi:phosphoribosylaminoimidazole-succinocarboxamide synthase
MNKKEIIKANLKNCLTETNFSDLGNFKKGKVRDTYEQPDKLILVTTDRQSAFDRILASVPFKGQVLNQVSEFWFNETKDIIGNAMLEVPDPNVMVSKKCKVFPVEVVVRGYITGSTDTSAWMAYKNGERNFCGNVLPEGMKKNQKFSEPIITPTTKSDKHDEKISAKDIVTRKIVAEEKWNKIASAALTIFKRGQEIAMKNGLILVDTKYEFGEDENGNVLLIDEVHTPDSSRYWIAATYEERYNKGEEPENIDKEFLRLWFVDHCDPYKDKVLPQAPEELVVELSSRYIQLYEMITSKQFQFPDAKIPVRDRIINNLAKYKI